MNWLSRLRRTFSSSDAFDEEARFHLEQRTAEYVRNGMSEADARCAALQRFGSVTHARERTRDVDVFRWLDDCRRDMGYAVRLLWRSPGFALLAILCLTLAIGANAAVFSWIEGLLLRPYPLVVDQDRLFAVTGTIRGDADFTDMSWPDWKDLERSSTLVDAFIADKITRTTLSVGDRAERAPGSIVSANYFTALGVSPLLGRGFLPGEDVGRNAHPVTVVSYQVWQDRFHGDPTVVGRTQLLNGLPHTIVGVAPPGFYGTFVGYAFEFWVPASMQPQFNAGVYKLEDRGARWIEGFIRLKPHVTIEQAQAELSAIMARLENDYPQTNRGRGIKLYPLWRTPFNNAGAMLPTLGIAVGVVLAVLLIACANVGNLLLVRAVGRQREMTIRLSIGAGRSRLIRQMLTEGLVLAALATLGGFVIAKWLQDALTLLTPPRGGVALRLPGELDWHVLAASAAVCVVATLLFGLVPAILSSRIDLASALRADSGGVIGSRRSAWVRSTLVLAQIALSFVLLVGASLLIESFQAIRTANPGFATTGVLTTSLDLFTAGYDVQRARTFQDELLDDLQTVGGIQSVALSASTPFTYASTASAPIAVDGFDVPRDQQPVVEFNSVTPGYFATMGIPITGRDFTRADDERAALVAIVDQTMATQFWRGADPVGSRVQVNGRWLQIVGVARATKQRNLVEAPRPYFYVPLRQNFGSSVALQIRTSLDAAAIRPLLVGAVHRLDANVAPGEIITMREQIERTTASQRIALTMLIVFGGVALLLAAIGLYGVMAATVAQSTRELALRMALGADASRLMRLVMSRGLIVTGAGVVVGGVAAWEITRLLGYLLYQVSPHDLIAFGTALGVIGTSAVLACLVPAWRATRTDPQAALRA